MDNEPNNNARVQRYYGIFRVANDELRSFVVTERFKIPEDLVEVRITTADEKSTTMLAERLLREYRPAPAPPPPPAPAQPDDDLMPGRLVIYEDGDGGKHCAILLEPTQHGNHWFACFLTSNKKWGSHPLLRASQDDLAFSGFVSSKTTYLAPVIRPAQFFRSEHGHSVPASRVAELLQFFRPYFVSRLPRE